MSVDEVLRLTVEKHQAYNGKDKHPLGYKEKKRVSLGGVLDINNSASTQHSSSSDVQSSQAGEQSNKSSQSSKHQSSKDLSIVSSGARNKPAFSETSSSYRRTAGKPPKGHRVGFSAVGTTFKHDSGETEYIQISSRIGNIKQAVPCQQNKQPTGGEAGSRERVTGPGMDDVLMHSPLAPQVSCVSKPDEVKVFPEDMGGGPPSPASSYAKSPSTSFQISIPTGDDASDGDSPLHSSSMRKMSLTDDEGLDTVSGHGKRQMTIRNKQIDDVTTLLAGSLMNGDGVPTDIKEQNDDDVGR